ncbi:hypothetical protein C2S52_010826 [Perilla frutescens var. hirtella]|nr:hypothetical protein C2S52_010826 [Perilla frutescens var. hirtella]KAH6817638.1 hypothetical protein C2S51_001241 [Perilla frutescens var. frutescens]
MGDNGVLFRQQQRSDRRYQTGNGKAINEQGKGRYRPRLFNSLPHEAHTHSTPTGHRWTGNPARRLIGNSRA